MSSQLIIKSHQPGKRVAVFIAVLFVVVGVGVGMYWLGQKEAGYHNDVLATEHAKLLQHMTGLQETNEALRNKNAELTQSVVIDKEAYTDVDSSLRRLQNEILELKEQITFYRGIVSPAKTATGLNVTRFLISKVGNNNAYHFKLVLTQVKPNNPLIRGNAKILINGVQHGEPKQLDVLTLSGETKLELKLGFKYFQTLEGNIVLPDGFIPSSVLVDLRPKGKGQRPIKQTFNWAQITT